MIEQQIKKSISSIDKRKRIQFFRWLPKYICKELLEEYGLNKKIYSDKDPAEVLASNLKDEDFQKIYIKYGFAGRKTSNLFYIQNISNLDINIEDLIKYFKDKGENLQARLDEVKVLENKIFFVFVTSEETTSSDWRVKEAQKIPETYILVLRKDTDIVEIRGSDWYKAKDIFDALVVYI